MRDCQCCLCSSDLECSAEKNGYLILYFSDEKVGVWHLWDIQLHISHVPIDICPIALEDAVTSSCLWGPPGVFSGSPLIYYLLLGYSCF